MLYSQYVEMLSNNRIDMQQHLSSHTIIQGLTTPKKIQDYLDAIPFNHEKNGETFRSAHEVVTHKEAHCLEGAFLACAALASHKRKPMIVSLKVQSLDFDHIITIFKEGSYFGAISKTNHAVLRWRDPIYRNVRELVMSYFHEYFLTSTGKKTLLGYTRPINLTRFGTSWITSSEPQCTIAYAIADTPFVSIIPKENKKYVRNATLLERKAASLSSKKEIPKETFL